MNVTQTFNQSTLAIMTALTLTVEAPAYANELPAAVMGKASEALVTLATTGKPRSVAGRTGWHRDVLGRLTKEGGQPAEPGKRGASGAQGPRHPDRRDLCDGGPHDHQG